MVPILCARSRDWHPAPENHIERVMKIAGVRSISMDHCQLGQCDKEGHPVKKPTKWMSNSEHILKALDKQCPGKHGWCIQRGQWVQHRPCYGEVAKSAAIYPFHLCRAILEGLVAEMRARGRWHSHAKAVLPQGCEAVAEPTDVLDILEGAFYSMAKEAHNGNYQLP